MDPRSVGLRSRVAGLAAIPSAKAVALGVVTVALAPVVFPLVRPVLKATIKSGVILFERAKSSIAETAEILADVAAEARAEAHIEAQKRTVAIEDGATAPRTSV
jgi:hypothetical protein